MIIIINDNNKYNDTKNNQHNSLYYYYHSSPRGDLTAKIGMIGLFRFEITDENPGYPMTNKHTQKTKKNY